MGAAKQVTRSVLWCSAFAGPCFVSRRFCLESWPSSKAFAPRGSPDAAAASGARRGLEEAAFEPGWSPYVAKVDGAMHPFLVLGTSRHLSLPLPLLRNRHTKRDTFHFYPAKSGSQGNQQGACFCMPSQPRKPRRSSERPSLAVVSREQSFFKDACA